MTFLQGKPLLVSQRSKKILFRQSKKFL
jgi:hypothetical protein